FVALAGDPSWRADPVRQGFLLELATVVGEQGRLDDVTRLITFLDGARFDSGQIYLMLAALGEGLLRTGSSLALVDPQYRLRRLYDQTEDLIVNENAADPLRIAALKLRSVSPYTVSGSGDFLQLLFGTQQSQALQMAAVATLSRYENQSIPDNLFARWPQLDPQLRSAAIAAFLSRAERVPIVLRRWKTEE